MSCKHVILFMHVNNCDYPLGADMPDAPWNWSKPVMVKCEACNGNGKHWYVYNIEANIENECTEAAWNALPETEELAEAVRSCYMRGAVEICEVCDGTGEVEYEEDYEPEYDD